MKKNTDYGINDFSDYAFNGTVDVVGWKGQTNIFETKSFNNLGYFDRQPYNLMYYCKDIVNEEK